MMKKLLAAFIVLLISAHAYMQSAGTYVPNEIMVMLKPGYTISDVLKPLNGQGLLGEFRNKEEVSKRYRIYVIEHDAVLGDSKNLLYDVKELEAVAIAQLNYYVQPRLTPNDASFTQQWNMNNTGGGGGTPDADIDAPEAWNITTGGVTADGDTIVVAVVDGGFQLNHPDLAANIYRNYGEIAGNGVDDDGNGYVDDRTGWDAFSNDGTIPSDLHGTHCAGIVGARGNNSTGVTGVNWNVKIMTVAGSSGSQTIVVRAYNYIATMRELYNTTNGAQGAFVVATSNSFGVDFGAPADFPIWCAMYDTLGALGILSAGAGPNANTNIDVQGDIPTTCPSNYMIAVTNTTNTDARNSSCGYGPINMDIGAPGTNIYSTVTGSNYNNLTGTSMATPHVAGAIGLYYAAACEEFIQDYKSDPGAMALQMRTYILTGVDSITSMATTTSSRGRLNIHKGIQKVLSYNCAGIPPVADFTANNNSICNGNTIQFTNASSDAVSYNWSFPGGTPATSTTANPLITYNTPGTYSVTLIATNPDGDDTLEMVNLITINAIPAAPVVTEAGGVLSSTYPTGNQWYDENGIIAGATANTYTPTSGGAYYVVYTDANGCTSTSNTYISTLSVEEDKVLTLSIYPNPAKDRVTIDAGNITKARVSMLDLSGRVVSTYTMNQQLMQVDISTLPAGIYMIRIESNGKTITRKLVHSQN